MSFCIDLNILLYAAFEENRWHVKAEEFLQLQMRSHEPCYMSWDTIYGFIRIATHSSVFKKPLSPKQALDNMQSIVSNPKVIMMEPSQESWAIYTKLVKDHSLRGALTVDAILAAHLEAHGINKLYTRDRDFWKFSYLKPVDPFNWFFQECLLRGGIHSTEVNILSREVGTTRDSYTDVVDFMRHQK